MGALPNVCLAKEALQDKVFLVCGGTKLCIPDPADFEVLGFKSDKVRGVPAGTLAGWVEKPLAPPVATKPSDVFFAARADSAAKSSVSPFHWGRWIPNLQSVDSLMSKNVLVAG